jgi:Asp-tRNA(Asn)/Glu-tRNA(Gln) amidotransferase A subunit family amidase
MVATKLSRDTSLLTTALSVTASRIPMDRNPYSPPQSPVADFQESHRLAPKPPRVAIAVKLFWLELCVSTIHAAWQLFDSVGDTTLVGIVLALAVPTLGLEAWVIYKISRGRNWARIVALVSVTLAILFALSSLKQTFSQSTIPAVLTAVETGLDVVALYLLFTAQANQWFKRPAAALRPHR